VADADEALWQHMEEEAAQELRSVERHDALLSAVSIILPSEGDPFTIEAEQAMVGNGDAMGVAAEIAQHMFGTAEGRLGIDELMSTNEEVSESIRPLLRLCREHIDRSIRMDTALLRSLERDPLLADRLRRLRTVPGVGPITALTWALEMGDTSRFHNIKQAISYCGLCSGEKSSAGKVMRTPISKQRNKHIQQVLVEAARLAPRYSDELALLYERERQRGNGNRATLAVARKMVASMLAVERRNTDFVPAGEFKRTAAA
jgi:transposase